MLKDAKRGKFAVLIVWALDRFGRSMVGNLSGVLELDRNRRDPRVGQGVVARHWIPRALPFGRHLLLGCGARTGKVHRENEGG
jgi:DNA invertase Pin-like site-specific DNA recombinase